MSPLNPVSCSFILIDVLQRHHWIFPLLQVRKLRSFYLNSIFSHCFLMWTGCRILNVHVGSTAYLTSTCELLTLWIFAGLLSVIGLWHYLLLFFKISPVFVSGSPPVSVRPLEDSVLLILPQLQVLFCHGCVVILRYDSHASRRGIRPRRLWR